MSSSVLSSPYTNMLENISDILSLAFTSPASSNSSTSNSSNSSTSNSSTSNSSTSNSSSTPVLGKRTLCHILDSSRVSTTEEKKILADKKLSRTDRFSTPLNFKRQKTGDSISVINQPTTFSTPSLFLDIMDRPNSFVSVSNLSVNNDIEPVTFPEPNLFLDVTSISTSPAHSTTSTLSTYEESDQYECKSIQTQVVVDGWNILFAYREYVLAHLPSTITNRSNIEKYFKGMGMIDYLLPRLCGVLKHWYRNSDVELVLKDYSMDSSVLPTSVDGKHFMVERIKNICQSFGISCHIAISCFDTFRDSLRKNSKMRSADRDKCVQSFIKPSNVTVSFDELEKKCFGFSKQYEHHNTYISDRDPSARVPHAKKGRDDFMFILILVNRLKQHKQNFINLKALTGDLYRDWKEFVAIDNFTHCYIDRNGVESFEKINVKYLFDKYMKENVNRVLGSINCSGINFDDVTSTLANGCVTALCYGSTCSCISELGGF